MCLTDRKQEDEEWVTCVDDMNFFWVGWDLGGWVDKKS